MKRIGLIGGMSWESTSSYYSMFNQLTAEVAEPWVQPRLLIDSIDFSEIRSEAHRAHRRYVMGVDKFLLLDVQSTDGRSRRALGPAATVDRFDRLQRNQIGSASGSSAVCHGSRQVPTTRCSIN